MTNTFYHGDCLFVMSHDIEPNSIDLIYLDPPFFTGKVQKGIAKWQPGAMEVSYEDSKKFWGDTKKVNAMRTKSPEWLIHIAQARPDFASYLFYMMERLEACHKVLKDTGSIYLHCDEKASHYLKMIMDELFELNFINEVTWQYTQSIKASTKKFLANHDTIFLYTKSQNYTFNPQTMPYTPSQLARFKHSDEQGRFYFDTRRNKHGEKDQVKVYLHKTGTPIGNVWYFPHAQGKEHTGYPTQKPLALLERIIKASSNKDDITLDPFCGCGTAIIAAQKLGRRWIGIDISKDAYNVSKDRYHQLTFDSTFGQPEPEYVERTLPDVEAIADTNEFEKWVNGFFKATKPYPDKGVDGIKQDGTPIQTKTNQIKEPVLHQFLHQVTTHPKVPQPVKHLIAVSKIGFDDNARILQSITESKEGIEVDLLTPAMMLQGNHNE